MSKELEALDRIKKDGIIIPSRANGKINATLAMLADRKKDLEIIEKALKAIEILRDKPFMITFNYDISYKKWLKTFYEDFQDTDIKPVCTEEEYNTIKEVLG